MYRVGYIGKVMEVAEYLFQQPGFDLKRIVLESEQLSEEMLTYSVVRNIPINLVSSEQSLHEALTTNGVDFYVMYSYGKKISERTIKAVPIFNIHPSYLPYYKGRHPTHWATIKNEKTLGIS